MSDPKKPDKPEKHPSSPHIIDVPPSGLGYVIGGVPPQKRFFLNPRTATLEDVLRFFRQVTGREPTEEDIKEARRLWEDEWKSPK